MTMTPKEALDLQFYCGDLSEVVTIRRYMKYLLLTLFEEGEGFSGKRPFGNSGWEHDLVKPLVMGGAVPGTFTVTDEDDEEVPASEHDIDTEADGEQYVEAYIDKGFKGYDQFIAEMIESL